MNSQDIRWQQRFQNFSKAFSVLEEAVVKHMPALQKYMNAQRSIKSGKVWQGREKALLFVVWMVVLPTTSSAHTIPPVESRFCILVLFKHLLSPKKDGIINMPSSGCIHES